MKKYSCLIFLCLLLICRQSGAQISLNPAVDTIHNKVNSKVIRVLSNYLNARLQKKDGKAFWIQAETDSLKNFDFYTAHSLYAIAFDNVIILGITQPDRDLFKAKVLFSYTGIDKVKTIWSINDFYMVKQDDTFKLKNALY